jgi:acetyl-CoA acetyltransferase
LETWLPKDKTCIVGIGETKYTKWSEIISSEFQLACEAILAAINDAGLRIKDIDGICSYSNDRNEPEMLAGALGIPHLRFNNMYWGGGGRGMAGSVMNACLAVATGSANNVVVFRSLSQGQFRRFGQSKFGERAGGVDAFLAPYGYTNQSHVHALLARRHMYEYGTTSRQFGAVAIACYKHAQRNPRAVMYNKPLTIEDHQKSRMIVDPFHLYDCCLETNGAAAVVITSAERARNLRKRPVFIMSASQGLTSSQGVVVQSKIREYNHPDFDNTNYENVVADLYKRAGITPKDIDVAQIYENFTSTVIMCLEDFGFCKKGEGGPFAEGGRLEWPDGELPLNTSGGNLAEAYIHGFEMVNEAVRQLRGISTCQVKDAEICLVAVGSTSTSYTSNLILRR